MTDTSRTAGRSQRQHGTGGRHYSAFLSYTDADRAAVERLQSRLENYRFPKKLAARLGFDRIKPVCVDRSEMRAASDLGEAIKNSLDRSDFLIVACTPRTPESFWVGEEIAYFRQTHGDSRILAALLEGEKTEAFHLQLTEFVQGERHEPLAADFRSQGDGPHRALLKLIASIADVDLDELLLRDWKRQRARRWTFGSLALLLATVIALLSYRVITSDEAIDNARIRMSEAMLEQLEALRLEVRDGGTLDMAASINRNVELYYATQVGDDAPPEMEAGRATALLSSSQTDINARDFASAEENAREAWVITSRLHREAPDNLDFTYDHAQSAFWLAYAAWLQRNTPLAAHLFDRYAQLADELVAAEPGNMDYVLEQGFAYSNLGMLALREARDPDLAKRLFDESQAAFRRVVRQDPEDTDTKFAIADGESWLADVAVERGDFESARSHRGEQLLLINELSENDPENRFYRSRRLARTIGTARLEAAARNYPEAIETLRVAEQEAAELVAGDPQNPSLRENQRMVALLQAQIELQGGGAAALRQAGELVGDCAADWLVSPEGELPIFCTILAAKLAMQAGRATTARELMRDERLASWLRSPSLSPIWRLDMQAECRTIGVPELCRPPAR